MNDNEIRRAALQVAGVTFREPVWVDMVTGAIYELPSRICSPYSSGKGVLLESVPYYDAPVVITERKLAMKD